MSSALLCAEHRAVEEGSGEEQQSNRGGGGGGGAEQQSNRLHQRDFSHPLMRNLTVVQSGELNDSKATLQVQQQRLFLGICQLPHVIVHSPYCTRSGLSCCLEINLAPAPLYIPVMLSIEVHPVLRPFAAQHMNCATCLFQRM